MMGAETQPFNRPWRIELLLPTFVVISAVVDATLYYFKDDASLTAFSFVRLAVYGFLVSYVVLFAPRFRLFDRVGFTIVGFLVYLLALVPFSSNPESSFTIWSRVAIGFSFYLLSYALTVDNAGLRRLLHAMQWAAIVIGVQVIIANVFRINLDTLSSYNLDVVSVGGGSAENAKTLAVVLLTAPLAFMLNKSAKGRWLGITAVAVSVVGIILYFNRSAMVATICGYLIMIVNLRQFRRFAPSFIGLAVIAGVVVYYLAPTLVPLFEERIITRDISEEPRARELVILLEDLPGQTTTRMLLGEEVFNSQEVPFAELSFGRQLHTDYAVLWHGAGVIGVSLYLIIIALCFSRIPARGRTFDLITDTGAPVMIALLVASAILSYGGSLDSIGLRATMMALAGALVRRFDDSIPLPTPQILTPTRSRVTASVS